MPNAYAENEQRTDGEAQYPGAQYPGAQYPGAQYTGSEHANPDEPAKLAAPVSVRRNAGVSALIGLAASAVAIAYLWRASQSMATLDWAMCLVMAVVAGGYLVSLVDARTPLLVADDLGVRIRLGHEWRGLPWEAVGHVVVHPRRGMLRDGRLVVVPRNLSRALEGLDTKGRRLVALNQKMYGAPLAVPLGLTTRLAQDHGTPLTEAVAALAQGRTEVVQLDPRTLEEAPVEPPAGKAPGDEAPAAEQAKAPAAAREFFPRRHTDDDGPVEKEASRSPAEALPVSDGGHVPDADDLTTTPAAPLPRAPGRRILGGLGTILSRMAKGDRADIDRRPADEAAPVEAAAPAPVPPSALRETRPALRAQTTIELPPAGNVPVQREGAQQPEEPSEGRALHRPGSVDLVVPPPVDDRVRPISTLGDPVEPLVIDDYAAEPAYDPVIGPELAAARTRLGLSVDDLAERTRIRPHVIESIEVDDFAPCGGDFYVRGHLRTLARILGLDPAPLLASFDERYATAPINARRVFEAELATGMTGSMRATAGGPRWGLLIGVVLTLVLVWGVLRLFTSTPPTEQVPTPVINGASVVQVEPVQQAPHGEVILPVG